MNAEKQLKLILLEEKKKLKEIADMLNISQPNLSQKIKRSSFKYDEMLQIAEKLNYEIIWKKKEEKK